MKTFLKATALTSAILLVIVGNAHAGGAVIIEDAAEAAPLVRSHDNRLVPLLFGLAVAAILLGGHDTCNNDGGDVPTPEAGC